MEARSCNHCCGGKATMLFVCVDELQVTVNKTKEMSLSQKCFYGKFMTPATTYLCLGIFC